MSQYIQTKKPVQELCSCGKTSSSCGAYRPRFRPSVWVLQAARATLLRRPSCLKGQLFTVEPQLVGLIHESELDR